LKGGDWLRSGSVEWYDYLEESCGVVLKSRNVCRLDSALVCEYVGICDVIVGLDSPCVRACGRLKVR
jgi:hypothetical protein